MKKFEIVDWNEKYHRDFINLSIEWLEKYVFVEDADLKILNDPHGQILDNGGNIFFAVTGTDVVGTVAMIKIDENTFELAKLAVTEQYKGYKIGNQLMEACIHYAKSKNAHKIILYTNQKLIPAIHLYKKYGFNEAPLVNNKYIESDMKMERLL
jgi:ribosomal protein S18 acetylase RimI-like enzyme